MAKYKVALIWFLPYRGDGEKIIEGKDMEDAVDTFYRNQRGAEIMEIKEQEE